MRGKEVQKRLHTRWIGKRTVSGLLCDKIASAKMKGKVYKTVVWIRNSMMRKRLKVELQVEVMEVLRFDSGVRLLERFRN